jgi:hypothetical protein
MEEPQKAERKKEKKKKEKKANQPFSPPTHTSDDSALPLLFHDTLLCVRMFSYNYFVWIGARGSARSCNLSSSVYILFFILFYFFQLISVMIKARRRWGIRAGKHWAWNKGPGEHVSLFNFIVFLESFPL